MKYRHVILEGKPATGKTEVSNLFKIYFPRQIHILPELVTVLVRENGLNIHTHRKELADMLRDAVPARKAQVQRIIAETDLLVFEESHMGVHLGYCQEFGDAFFLDIYEEAIKPHILEPDIYLRLDMPVPLSVVRQTARATPDVEVSAEWVTRAFDNVDRWHAEMKHDNLVTVNANRSPDLVTREILDIMGVQYQVWAG